MKKLISYHIEYVVFINLCYCFLLADEINRDTCQLAPNGSAIWGDCVTRRKHRVESWYFSRETVTVQGGYGALFAVQVQNLLSITCVAVQV
jgi:hypothetical protein